MGGAAGGDAQDRAQPRAWELTVLRGRQHHAVAARDCPGIVPGSWKPPAGITASSWNLAHLPARAAPQVARARECEANTGPAQKPDLAAAGQQGGTAGGGAGEDEVDPLDAFMAEIGQIETAAAPAKPRHERVEAEDTAAEFMEASAVVWCMCGVVMGSVWKVQERLMVLRCIWMHRDGCCSAWG